MLAPRPSQRRPISIIAAIPVDFLAHRRRRSASNLAITVPIDVRIPTKPAMHSNSKPAGYSDLKPATRGVVRMGQFHDVVEGWEGQEIG